MSEKSKSADYVFPIDFKNDRKYFREAFPLLFPKDDSPDDSIESLQVAGLRGQIKHREKDKLIDEIEKRVVSGIEELLRGPKLDNYHGWLCAKIVDEPENVESGKTYQLEVWLQPETPPDVVSEEVDIRDGQDAELVTFAIEVDSDDFEFRPDRSKLENVFLNQKSDSLLFEFTVPKETEANTYELWVQIFQKNRFIQVLELKGKVDAKGE